MTTSTPPPVRPRPDAHRPHPRRPRARVVVPLAVAVWVVLEIYLLTLVAGATNGLTVLLLLLAGFVLGAVAVRRAGSSAWRNLAASVSARQAGAAPPPSPESGGRTGLAMLGGLLLMIPGFVSDLAALVLLFPPTRRLAGRFADRLAARTLRRHGAFPPSGFGSPGFPHSPGFPPRPGQEGPAGPAGPAGGKVIQGEVIDRD